MSGSPTRQMMKEGKKHPPMKEIVIEALTQKQERRGLSLVGIKAYILHTYGPEVTMKPTFKHRLRTTLSNGLKAGVFKRAKGSEEKTGVAGFFKLVMEKPQAASKTKKQPTSVSPIRKVTTKKRSRSTSREKVTSRKPSRSASPVRKKAAAKKASSKPKTKSHDERKVAQAQGRDVKKPKKTAASATKTQPKKPQKEKTTPKKISAPKAAVKKAKVKSTPKKTSTPKAVIKKPTAKRPKKSAA